MIVKLQGGQGNQIFQFAYGFAEGRRRCEPVSFDTSSFEHDSLRHYELDAYDIPIRLENSPEAESGYWQGERYFAPYHYHINQYFRIPKGEPNAKCKEMAKRIQGSESCFIGVRRADYLWPERINYHGVMLLDYYFEAIRRLALPYGSGMYVFTDDLLWAQENLPFAEIVDVNGPNEKAWDIWLMSLCQHAIIANSTFHWWGAYLGADRMGGTVVAPKKWFANGMKSEIVPERWITL